VIEWRFLSHWHRCHGQHHQTSNRANDHHLHKSKYNLLIYFCSLPIQLIFFYLHCGIGIKTSLREGWLVGK
jgi:hypothetical protein